MGEEPRISPDLSGVPETLLWTLYYRAQEAARPDGVIRDPLAVEFVERVDYPFAERLGRGGSAGPVAGPAGGDLRRARPATSWRRTPAAPWSRWAKGSRPSSGGWTTPVCAGSASTCRPPGRYAGRCLPQHARRRQLDVSVLDEAWTEEVDPCHGVLVTAQGLLDVPGPRRGAQAWSRCWPAASRVASWCSTASRVDQLPSRPGARRRRAAPMPAPPMPWAMDGREAACPRGRCPACERVVRLHPPRGRGALHGCCCRRWSRHARPRRLLLSIWSARFG